MMKTTRILKKTLTPLFATAMAVAITLPASMALAEFPEKPITMLIGFRPGGAVDTTGRLLAKALEEVLGQPVVAVSRAGGGGTVMASTLINAKPDGYTIGMGASAAYTLAPQLNTKITYKIDDFDHIATVSIPQDAIVVKADSPWNSLADMVNDARKTGKVISVSSQVAVVNLMAAVISKKSGVKFKIVPVKGGSRGILQVLGGHTDWTWSASGWHKQIAAGTMKPLASIGRKRNPDYPNIPTMMELGYNYTFTDTFMLSAPKGLPKDVLERLSSAVKKVLTAEFDQNLRDKMKLSVDYRDSAGTAKFLHEQYDFIAPLVADMKK